MVQSDSSPFLNNHKNENLKLQRVHRQENMEC